MRGRDDDRKRARSDVEGLLNLWVRTFSEWCERLTYGASGLYGLS